ncbi:MAG: type II secretion system minor pseudopilin GspK [Thermodesulfovibrionales bacterium]
MNRLSAPFSDAGGMALVLTLLVVAVITAMVVEFSYGVYISTSSLHNWQTAQRLSLLGKSVINLAAEMLSDTNRRLSYTYPGVLEFPTAEPVRGFNGSAVIRIEDENAKFNLNTLVYANGLLNENAYQSFLRLLAALQLDPAIADRLADWIDPDTEPRRRDSEEKAKNGFLDSVDELLLIPGIDRKSYEALLPYVTLYGNGLININGADIPVLMSLSDSIDREMAGRIVQYRGHTPFEKTENIVKVAGFETVGTSLMGRITVKGSAFSVVSTAASGGIRNSIQCVLDMSGSRPVVKYWKER